MYFSSKPHLCTAPFNKPQENLSKFSQQSQNFSLVSTNILMLRHLSSGTARQNFYSLGKHQRRRLIYGVWAASWLSFCAVESLFREEIVSLET